MTDEELIKRIKETNDNELQFNLYKQIKDDDKKIKSLKFLKSTLYTSAIKLIEDDDKKISMLTCVETKYEMVSIIESIKDDIKKEKFIEKIKDDQSLLIRLIRSLKSEIIKDKYIDLITNEINRAMIISEYKDEILKEKNIIKLNSDVSRGMVINSLKSDELKKEHLKDIRQYNIIISIITGMKSDEIKMKLADIEYRDYMPEIVKSLTDDNNKIKYINGTKKTYKKSIFEYEWLDVIKSLKSDEIKKDYYNDKRFDECKAEILATIKDEKYIKLEFLNHNCNNKKEEKFCLKLIETIKDETLKKYLIENLNNKKYKKLLNSNNEKIKKELLKDVPDNLKNKNIDKNLTIGVELEVEGEKHSEYLNVKKIFSNWNIKQEGSLDAGIEVTSPILQYKEEDLKELYFICNLLQEEGFITNDNCAGHIHFGGNYLTTVEEYKMFYYIFGNCESIFTLISNRKGSKPRSNTKIFSKPISKKIEKKIKENGFDGIYNVEAFVDRMFYGVQEDRDTTINIQNMIKNKKTIEIRVPNGELDFNELMNNIYLYATLLTKSKEYANTTDTEKLKKIKKLSERTTQRKRIDLLLDILFDNEEDKKVYKERFENNSNIIYKLTNQENVIYYNLDRKNKRR